MALGCHPQLKKEVNVSFTLPNKKKNTMVACNLQFETVKKSASTNSRWPGEPCVFAHWKDSKRDFPRYKNRWGCFSPRNDHICHPKNKKKTENHRLKRAGWDRGYGYVMTFPGGSVSHPQKMWDGHAWFFQIIRKYSALQRLKNWGNTFQLDAKNTSFLQSCSALMFQSQRVMYKYETKKKPLGILKGQVQIQKMTAPNAGSKWEMRLGGTKIIHWIVQEITLFGYRDMIKKNPIRMPSSLATNH